MKPAGGVANQVLLTLVGVQAVQVIANSGHDDMIVRASFSRSTYRLPDVLRLPLRNYPRPLRLTASAIA